MAIFLLYGAGEESRTLDLNLGKVALYQLSYSRMSDANYSRCRSAILGIQIIGVTAPSIASIAPVM